MEEQQEIIRQLLDKVKNARATAEECEQLLQFIHGNQSEEVISFINDYYEEQQLEFKGKYSQWKEVLNNIIAVDKKDALSDRQAPVRSLLFRRWWVAASVIALLGLGIYIYHSSGKQRAPVVAKTETDIAAPVNSRAMIELADGTSVYLDSTNNGELVEQGDVKLMKLANDQIVYQSARGRSLKEVQYNTLINPRGSKVMSVTLTDGTKVWLNVGSSITYPVAFIGGERKVELKGEAFFDVAKDATKPFRVVANNMEANVLGTQFNISAYSEDENISTTLLSGSLKVKSGDMQRLLLPGQQVVATRNSLLLSKDLNTEEVLSWKEGIFLFENKDVKSIMHQLARWYDIEVVYQGGNVSELFTANLSREVPLSRVLQYLQSTGHIQFTTEGKKVIVKP